MQTRGAAAWSAALELVLSRLPQAKPLNPAQTKWVSPCPAHDDHKPSLYLDAGRDGRVLLWCGAGCPTEAVVAALGLTLADLMPPAGSPKSEIRNPKERSQEYLTEAARQTPCFQALGMPPVSLPAPQAPARPNEAPHTPLRAPQFYATVAEAIGELERRHGPFDALWSYNDAQDEPLGAILRWNRPDGKDIRPVSRRPEGWVIGGMREPRPLYRLSDLRRRPTERVYVTEGEKAAEAGERLGLLTTTSPHGSGSAAKADWSPLAGRDVVLLPDNDEPGRKYARDVTALLLALTPPATVRIVPLPDLPPKGDLYDWLQGRDATETPTPREQLDYLVEAAATEVASGNCQVSSAPPERPGASSLQTSRLTLPPAALPPAVAVAQCLEDIEEREVEWLWPGRVPLGQITLLVGKPGVGKSFLTADMAARVSAGRPWPDGTPNTSGAVLLIGVEDNPGATIRPRVRTHGADLRRVYQFSLVRQTAPDGRPYEALFSLGDLAPLEGLLRLHPDCKLVVIDPVGSFLGGRLDSHRDSEVRAVLAPLAKLAEQYGPAVVLVAHRRKSAAPSADDLALGSVAFTGIARAVWHLARDPEDKDRRLLLSGKNNLAAEGRGLAFTIAGTPPLLQWERDAVDLNADEAVRRENAAAGADDSGPLQEAIAWLETILADGPLPTKEICRLAKEEGLALPTVKRAKVKLGLQAKKEGFGDGAAWSWGLPPEPQGAAPAAGRVAEPEPVRSAA